MKNVSSTSVDGVCAGRTLLSTTSGGFEPSSIFSVFEQDLDALKLL